MNETDEAYGAEAVIERQGCLLHYWLRETSRPAAPLIMFIHGAGVDHRMWAGQMDVFAEHYRILTVDLRGHGQSRPATGYSFQALVDDAISILDRVGAEKVAVVGLSMGGNVAQEMVFRDPARYAGIVCADCTSNTLVPPFDRLLLPVYDALFAPLLALFPMSLLVRQIGQTSAITAEGRRYLSTVMAQHSKQELARIMKALLRALHHEGDYKVPIPQLLCYGAGDRLGNIRQVMPKWCARDPHCELVVIPDASHCSVIDNPAFFNRTALDWLARIPG